MNGFNVFIVVLAILAALGVGLIVGSSLGHPQGRSEACASVGMEWHNKSCVRVTREKP